MVIKILNDNSQKYLDPSIQEAIDAGSKAVNQVKSTQPQTQERELETGPGGIKYGVVSEKTLGRWAVGKPLPQNITKQIGAPVVLDPNQNFATQAGRPLTKEELKAYREQAGKFGQPGLDIPTQTAGEPLIPGALPLNSIPTFQNYGNPTGQTTTTTTKYQNNYINTYGVGSVSPLVQNQIPQGTITQKTTTTTTHGLGTQMTHSEINQYIPGAIVNGENGINIPGLPKGIPIVMNGCTIQELMQMPLEGQPLQHLPPTYVEGSSVNNGGFTVI